MRTVLDENTAAATAAAAGPATAPTDAQLVAQSLEEPARFAELFRRHVDAIYRFAAVRVGPEHAEDVVAATFATAFDRRARFDPERAASARPWLYGIAANRLHKHRDAERRWLEHARLERPGVPEPLEALAEARVDAERLRPELAAALRALTPAERDVVVLFALEELDHDQIAQALGIRRGTARTRLSRGCARLRAALETHDATPGSQEGRP